MAILECTLYPGKEYSIYTIGGKCFSHIKLVSSSNLAFTSNKGRYVCHFDTALLRSIHDAAYFGHPVLDDLDMVNIRGSIAVLPKKLDYSFILMIRYMDEKVISCYYIKNIICLFKQWNGKRWRRCIFGVNLNFVSNGNLENHCCCRYPPSGNKSS